MAKYFVQSGTLRTTVEAESSRKAALWAVHQAMKQVLPLEDTEQNTAESKHESASEGRLNVMDSVVRVSECGFDRDDAPALATMDVVQEWNEMFAALDRLQRLLDQRGIAA